MGLEAMEVFIFHFGGDALRIYYFVNIFFFLAGWSI